MLLQRQNMNFGPVLYEARCRSLVASSIPRQKLLFEIHLVALGAFVFLDLYFVRESIGRLGQSWFFQSAWSWFYISSMVVASLGVLYTLVSLSVTSFSRDCIFEKGITCFNHTLVDYLRNDIYHSFNEIKRIEIEKLEPRDSGVQGELMRIFEQGRKNRTILCSSFYENDYWDMLKSVLKERCPEASWVKSAREKANTKARGLILN